MPAADYLRDRRIALGLTDAEVAARSGLTIHEYCDIEQHSDEFATALSLGAARRLCDTLAVDVADVLGISGTGCPPPLDAIPRHDQVRIARMRARLSGAEVADRIGFSTETVESIEMRASFLDTLPIDVVLDLCNALAIPPECLLKAD